MVELLLITRAAPLATLSMPSVTMKEGIFHCSTTKPLIEAAERADAHAAEERERNGDDERQVLVGHDQRADDRAQRQHRADRKVDAAGQDDEGHARGEHGVDRDLDEDLEKVLGRGEIGRGQREEDHDQDESRRRRPPRASQKRRMSFQSAAARRPRPASVASLKSVFLVGHRQDAMLVELGSRDLADDPALGEDDDAVGDRDQLRQVGRDEQDAACLPRRASTGGRRSPPWRRRRCRASARRRSAPSSRGTATWRSPPSAGCRRRSCAPSGRSTAS